MPAINHHHVPLTILLIFLRYAPSYNLLQLNLLYLLQLTDSTFKSAYQDIFGTDPSNDIMTHSRRELVHAVYLLLMDKDFMHAYVYGCELEFWDGIIRQWFPRWFIHATDYPEKYVLPLLPFQHCLTHGVPLQNSNGLHQIP